MLQPHNQIPTDKDFQRLRDSTRSTLTDPTKMISVKLGKYQG